MFTACSYMICLLNSSKLLQLPVPKLVVFYNGVRDKQDELFLNLSDSFDERFRSEADVEVRVRMLNVNYGHNQKLMEACRPLYEYAWYIDTVRQYHRKIGIEFALSRAINDMPEEFIIKQFMMIHKSEVFNMLLCEYNEEEVMHSVKKETIADTNEFYAWLFKNGRGADAEKAASDESEFIKLYEEYAEANGKDKDLL